MGARVFGIGLFCAAWPALAHAEIQIDTPAGADCIGAAELEARTAEWFRQSDSAARFDASELLANNVRVQLLPRDGGGWSASVEVGPARGNVLARRQISTSASDCRDLDAALVVVLGVLLESLANEVNRAHRGTELEPAHEASPADRAPAVSPRITFGPADSPPADPSARSGGGAASARTPWFVRAGAAAAAGALPDPVLITELGVRVPLARRLALRSSLDFTPLPAVVRLDESKVRFSLATVKALGCWAVFEAGSAGLDACAGANSGLAVTESLGIKGRTPLVRPVLWGLGEVHAAYRISAALLADAHVAAGLAAIRDEYVATRTSGEELTIRPTAAGTFELGMALAVQID